ncbi:MAG TPA: DUF2254 domain-containing protein [Xanthobacteraceae bacterium]|jgi:uncharacterized membrane protein|nr:DUF2254 domain-containing protein [Xanthobacteraceae bacterium]
MRLWSIPMIYLGASVVCGLTLPRIEQAYGSLFALNLSVASAQAYLSAATSGMMALTGIIFALAFVMVQFSAVAYSPRLVLWFARDRLLFHSLGAFSATFLYALFTLAWIDRGGSGAGPALSMAAVAIMIVVSMVMFALLVQRLPTLQITNVLQLIGDKGRDVIRDMFEQQEAAQTSDHISERGPDQTTMLGPSTQILTYSGRPQTIAKFKIDALVEQARKHDAMIEMASAVGDTLVDGDVVLRVHAAKGRIGDDDLLHAIDLAGERTFEQDPKYPIRLLVDIAIRALSPAINDPTSAVQAIDQIEDLLRRLGRYELNTGFARDGDGKLRLTIPMPTWEDYLALAFDEIRQYGATSVQVMRRLRSALVDLAETTAPARAEAVRHYLLHLDLTVEHSLFDSEDKKTALQEDRQGLGLSRRRSEKI